MRITAEWLRERGACESAVAEFAARFPVGADLTRENVVACADFNLDWLAEQVLTAPAWAAYEAARATAAWAAYEATRAQAFADQIEAGGLIPALAQPDTAARCGAPERD